MDDPYNLQRFVTAQAPVFKQVVAELERGRKTSHWMWFIFPQLRGLGRSPMAMTYALSGLAEAKAYLDHPILGPRLAECTGLINALGGSDAEAVFGSIDAVKLRSCLTLFGRAAGSGSPYQLALEKYFDGQPDPATTELLEQ